jgi:hypothetical protein
MQCSFLFREGPELALVMILSAYLNPLLKGRKRKGGEATPGILCWVPKNPVL